MIKCPKCSAQIPEESKFCLSCGQEVSLLSQMPTVAAPEGVVPQAPVNAPHVGRIVSSDSVPAGGFTPGTILADRYRIIGLLGRGGMGEVYRADDLKLGQPVALKFLPPKFAEDSVRRERFFAEVCITRQLSHPNICLVYDTGDVDSRHFLSMEYIDGEDLASLMKPHRAPFKRKGPQYPTGIRNCVSTFSGLGLLFPTIRAHPVLERFRYA
jgi:serine/threonine-protein kinase